MRNSPAFQYYDAISEADRVRVRKIVGHAAHYLPAQGPIGVFIHHNTLHAFQHLPFEKAVPQAAALFKTEPYMSEEAYGRELGRGRIRPEDIDAVLEREANDAILPGRLDRRRLRRLMLLSRLRSFDPSTIQWQIAEGGLLEAFRNDLGTSTLADLGPSNSASVEALFMACLERSPTASVNGGPQHPVRPHDGILALNGGNLDDAIHPALIRLTSAFVDQGMAYWPMPNRDAGLLKAARGVLLEPGCILPEQLRLLPVILRWHEEAGLDAESVVIDVLNSVGVPSAEWESMLQGELLALPGWAGIVRRLEEEPQLAPYRRVQAQLMDFLALRLSLTLAATIAMSGARTNWRVPVLKFGARESGLATAANLFDVAQIAGLSAAAIRQMSKPQFQRFWEEVTWFNPLERRRVFHLAYERRHERQILLPLLRHTEEHRNRPPTSARPAAQVFFCIDEREESMRRQLEETDPEIETYGAAGFFGVAVDYAGIDDAHGVPLCPVVVKPAHAIRERPAQGHQEAHQKRIRVRRTYASLARHSYVSSRTLLRGWISTAILGLFTLFPLAAKVLAPRQYGRLIEWLNRWFLPEPRTELAFMRDDSEGLHATEGLMFGFTVAEKADRVAGVLRPTGVHRNFARMVVVLGHGSTSLNNPHESAHDCGACGGRRGGPNGRLFAAIANHPEVRKALVPLGIVIPEDTWFVGGYHDTCSDEVTLYDLAAVPESHAADLLRVRASLDRSRALSAHERVRRFEACAPGDATHALHHVEERAEHLAEPRPEYGHCTNAVCIVGRRSTTRGLFLDRRAFLVSYDASLDPEGTMLGGILGAVVPVCGGINLEYYFSFVDNEGYGCGTKLPHNVTGLLGVMNGYQSDLRTGLPWQMVEIHEPVRILFVIEADPGVVLATMHRNALVSEFLENRWIRLAVQDPSSGKIFVYRSQDNSQGAFEEIDGTDETLPTAPTSPAWYEGKLQHLPLARIESKISRSDA